jgi:hypothetical protein
MVPACLFSFPLLRQQAFHPIAVFGAERWGRRRLAVADPPAVRPDVVGAVEDPSKTDGDRLVSRQERYGGLGECLFQPYRVNEVILEPVITVDANMVNR